jgi:outer membrane protein assembly factor BamB
MPDPAEQKCGMAGIFQHPPRRRFASSFPFGAACLLILAAAPQAQTSQPAAWEGFQGNAGHTGASAEATPAAYQPLWVARPDPVPKQGKATSVTFDGKRIISDISPATIPNCLAEDEYAVVAYDPSDGSQEWRMPTRGKLVGSPHVSGDRVYAMVWDCPPSGNFAESSTLYAIDSSDGRVAWQQKLARIEAGPPVVAAGLVFVPGREGQALLAYDALTGEARWEAPLLDTSRHTIEAPAVLGDTVFAVDAGHLYAFDIASGAQRWRVDTDGKGWRLRRFHGSPVAADGMVMVVAQSVLPPPAAHSRFSFEAYDAATGAFRSGITLAENDWANVNWGVSYSAGRAFISGAWRDRTGKIQKGIIAFDVATSTEAWRVALGAAVYPPAIDSAGYLLVTGELGNAWLLDAATGTIQWISSETHIATNWFGQNANGEPQPGMPGRDEWLPNRWGTNVGGAAVLLDSVGHLGGLPPVLAGGLAFGHTGNAKPYLVAFGADTTPPSAQIRRPSGGYVTLTNESVLGTAYDYNLKSWRLEYGSGPDPQSWITLKEDTRPRQGNPYLMDGLAGWKADRLGSGVWTLRLVVSDTAGQTSTTTTQLNNDLNPPTIKIEWPVDGMTVDSADLTIRGSASDDFEVKQVKVAVPGGDTMQPAEGTRQWTFAYNATNRDAGDWITIEATAEDMNGHTTRDQVRVRMAPLRLQVSDLGRRLTSNYPIFVSPALGRDHDGLLDAWEEAAIPLTEAVIVVDEEEDWLRNRTAEPVAQFARVRPYVPAAPAAGLYQETPIGQDRDLVADPPPFVVFQYVLRWAKDYGRFGIEGHDIDTEKYFMAWRVVDSRNLELAYVFTSSHRSPNAHHSVWHAWDASCNVTDVANLWNEAEREFEEYDHSEVLCGGVEFQPDGRLVLYASEDKHAIYPSEAVCESVTLTENVGPNAGEDCGWQPSASPLSDSHWNDGDFAGDPRYLKGGRWLLDVVNTGDEPYILVGDGDILGLAVPLGTLENGNDNPPQILRRAMAARYRVEIQTGDRNLLAGIGRVDLHLVGSLASDALEIHPVAQPPRNSVYAGNFVRGGTDIFYGIERDLGEISSVALEIHAFGLFRPQALRVDWVRVTAIDTGRSWTFPGAGWMPGSPDGTLSTLAAGAAPAATRYRISVLTGDRKNAGTDAKVTIGLIGADGATSGPLDLDTPGRNDFERGQLDVFTLSAPANISELATIALDQDNGGDGPGWYVREVRVKNLASGREWVFYAERWLADDEPGGRTARLIPSADCGTASYRVKIFTSGINKAGTDADVFVNLLATGGCRSGEILLDGAGNDFEAGHADTFVVRAPNVASLERVLLRHDNSGDDAGWHVSSIVVENLTMNWKQVFNPNVWLEGDHLCWASTGACP